MIRALALALLLPSWCGAAAPPNELWGWLQEYAARAPSCGKMIDPGRRREIETARERFVKNPNLVPMTALARHYTDLAVRKLGPACRAPASGACGLFEEHSECLTQALTLYLRDGLKAVDMALQVPGGDAGSPMAADSDMIAQSLGIAIKAYEELDRLSITYEDPRPPDERIIQRIVDTGVGHFETAGQDDQLFSLVGPDILNDRGMSPTPTGRCPNKITLAELFYAALHVSGGSMPQAAGAIAGVLHDRRDAANCVRGLRGSSNGLKDYYRFAGLYIGLQRDGPTRVAGAAGAQAQTASYGLVRISEYCAPIVVAPVLALTAKNRALCEKGWRYADYQAKFPELWVGMKAGLMTQERNPE